MADGTSSKLAAVGILNPSLNPLLSERAGLLAGVAMNCQREKLPGGDHISSSAVPPDLAEVVPASGDNNFFLRVFFGGFSP